MSEDAAGALISQLDELYAMAHIDGMNETLAKGGATGSRKAHWTMRDGRTGAFVTVAEGRGSVPQAREIERALSLGTNSVSVVLKALRAATTGSRRAGTSLQFVVEVEPDGTPRIVNTLAEAAPSKVVAAELEMDAGEQAELERALGDARERGRHRVAEILAGEDMLNADAFADHLQTTRATINTWRQGHQVLALQGATRGFRYPVWQIGEDGRPFAALPKLFALSSNSPWAVYRFLVQAHDELDGLTGLEALRRGRDAEAIEVAESIADGAFV